MLSLEFGDFEALCVLRQTEKLIVSFAGIGDLANDNPDYEWIESLISWNNEYSFIFIKDNSRSWYTSGTGIQELAFWLRKLIDELAIKKSIAFGLSMGAYGAMIVDNLVEFDLVIALSSRAKVGAQAGFDPRLESLSLKVRDHPNNDSLNLIRDDGNYVYLYSIDDPCDMMHATRLYSIKKPNLRFFKTRGQHNIGYNIKKTFGLDSFFDWIFIHDCSTTHFAFTPFTDSLIEIASILEHLGHPDRLSYDDYLKYFLKSDIEYIPRIILDDILKHTVDKTLTLFEEKRAPRNISCTEHVRLHLLPIVPYCYLSPEEFVRNLAFGWSDLEPHGCWAVGRWHGIEGRIIGISGSKHVLAIEYDIYLPDGKSQNIRFFLNEKDIPIVQKTYKGSENSDVVIIPISESSISLLIETPDFTSPKANNDGDDHRPLSLFIKSLAIVSIQ